MQLVYSTASAAWANSVLYTVNRYTYIYFFHHTTCESPCDTLASSAANQGDNTVSVAQGGTATPGATEQLLPPDKSMIFVYRQSPENKYFSKININFAIYQF